MVLYGVFPYIVPTLIVLNWVGQRRVVPAADSYRSTIVLPASVTAVWANSRPLADAPVPMVIAV